MCVSLAYKQIHINDMLIKLRVSSLQKASSSSKKIHNPG